MLNFRFPVHSIMRLVSILLLVTACAGVPDSAWTVMSDSLDDWHQIGDANWHMEEHVFIADNGNGFLVTPESYTDVHIQLEFWVSGEANSGVFLRVQNSANITDMNAYEVNIFDSRPDQAYRTGGVVHFSAPAQVIHTSGRWNSYDIRIQGNRLQVRLNGNKTVDMVDDSYAAGPLALQYAAGEVRFRNVRIRPL